jgi:hypothetical protein
MKDKTSSREKEGRSDQAMSDLTGKAMKNCEQALRTGLKLQEEAVLWWTNMINHTAAAQDWQKPLQTATTLAEGIMPEAQKRMEEVLGLMEKNSRTGAELVKKAVDAAQTPVLSESQAKWMDFWTDSMGAARAGTEELTQIGSKALDSWVDFVRKNTELTVIQVPKTA